MPSQRAEGFTLIELMIVVAIVAILAMIAIPSFADQMRKSRRAEAISSMQDAQLRLERWRVDHADYSGSGATIANNNHYTYTITATAGSNDYKIEAVPKGGQSKDSCGTLSITVTSGGHPTKVPSSCW